MGKLVFEATFKCVEDDGNVISLGSGKFEMTEEEMSGPLSEKRMEVGLQMALLDSVSQFQSATGKVE